MKNNMKIDALLLSLEAQIEKIENELAVLNSNRRRSGTKPSVLRSIDDQIHQKQRLLDAKRKELDLVEERPMER